MSDDAPARPLPTPCYDRREPCAKCPYRLDAPLAKWHADHFIKLANDDNDPLSPMYACHNRDGNVCVGWALDQRERGLPNFVLRLAMSRHPELCDQIAEATDGGHPRFESVHAMCDANLVAIRLGHKKSRRR